MAEMLQHHRAGPDLADGIGDAPARDVGRRAVDGLEHGRVFSLGIEIGRGGDADRACDRRAQVGQDVAEEIGTDFNSSIPVDSDSLRE